MEVVKLKFKSVEQMVNNRSLGVIVLTDELEGRQLNIVCDEASLFQLNLRHRRSALQKGQMMGQESQSEDQRQEPFPMQQMLPEVLSSILSYYTDVRLRVRIKDLVDGQYRVLVEDVITGNAFPIRASDGVLLNVVNPRIPICADEIVWRYQSVPYSSSTTGIPIPVNALTEGILEEALQKAIDEEQYEVAQHLKDELDRRRNSKKK